jgi:hypothetical protein
MHCPNCGLTIQPRAPFLTMDHCPRCLARRGAIISMEISDQRPGSDPAAGLAEVRPATEPGEDDRPARGG